jgi:hypothetical protein
MRYQSKAKSESDYLGLSLAVVVGTTLRDKGMSDEIRETGPASLL